MNVQIHDEICGRNTPLESRVDESSCSSHTGFGGHDEGTKEDKR
jgi:hypothetical protein